ncbi:hypothetical protein BJV78DRAFT_1246731 [Lactifluus subvellereus]|nr:hypothetical protein BJV78DRAFT_1246731 [Lactifluus subvellereus]
MSRRLDRDRVEKGVTYVRSVNFVWPAPPVRPTIRPLPSAMMKPESPEAEKAPSLLLYG